MNQNWFRRRWFDFRQGHSVYLIFLLTFANFILIFHRLLIERIDFLDQLFSELWVFIIVFVAIYVPIAIIIGAWHRKTQLSVEADVIIRRNPLLAKILRTIMDSQTGNVTKEELEEMRKLLKDIEDGRGQ
jgi:hypothetical protein